MKTVILDVHTPSAVAVHSDLTAWLSAGVLDRAATGQVVFPYESVKADSLLQAA